MEFTDYIKPFCIPFGGEYPADSLQYNDNGIPVTLAGFGHTVYNATRKKSKNKIWRKTDRKNS